MHLYPIWDASKNGVFTRTVFKYAPNVRRVPQDISIIELIYISCADQKSIAARKFSADLIKVEEARLLEKEAARQVVLFRRAQAGVASDAPLSETALYSFPSSAPANAD
jgi:hypothetical protein